MERLSLIGGSYSARWVGAQACRCINYFPEANPKDALVPTTHYQRPGLRPLVQPLAAAPVRALYRSSNMQLVNGVWQGQAYAVVGANVYAIGPPPTWTATLLGSITLNRSNICSMIDNGTTVLLVDGSNQGWTINLASNAFALVNDGTGTFVGADRVDYIDTFIVGNIPGTNQFFSTLSNSITFDGTYVAGKTDYPDPLSSLIVNRHELLLMGLLKSEIWYDAGNALFPFAELPGAYIEHGLVAKYSLAATDINVYWLHQDLQGQGMVLRQRGYETSRISNHALEYAIRKMANSVGIADAIGYVWQQDGHVFYTLHFPAGDQTWVFDESIGSPIEGWHQEAWSDQNGILHRHRGNCFANLYGTNVVGDWQNGTLYAMDPEAYVDTFMDESVYPLTCIRSFPHIGTGRISGTMQPADTNGRQQTHNAFWLDLECGNAPQSIGGEPAQISLRWSDDKGKSWGNDVLQSAGAPGQYKTQPQWRGLGSNTRDRVYEISHAIAGPSACNGAWVDVEVNAMPQ